MGAGALSLKDWFLFLESDPARTVAAWCFRAIFCCHDLGSCPLLRESCLDEQMERRQHDPFVDNYWQLPFAWAVAAAPLLIVLFS